MYLNNQRSTTGVYSRSNTFYINYIGFNVSKCKIHLYADDTVMYATASSITQAISNLQQDFNIIQDALFHLKLVLNSKKHSLEPAESALLKYLPQRVTSYKYLGIWLDEKLSFKIHITNLIKKLRTKLGFFYRNKSCFTFNSKKTIVQTTFLSVLLWRSICTHLQTFSLIFC